MISRRSFIAGILASGVSPVIIPASSLMPIYVPPLLILYGDGIHDDTLALQHWLDGGAVKIKESMSIYTGDMVRGKFKISKTIKLIQNQILTKDELIS